MALSRIAAQFAAEIKQHDWSDAPYRIDRAGHDHQVDGQHGGTKQLALDETSNVKTNAAWVSAQVLAYNDPNFDVHEFFEACGLDPNNSDGRRGAWVRYGLRWDEMEDGSRRFQIPGTHQYEE